LVNKPRTRLSITIDDYCQYFGKITFGRGSSGDTKCGSETTNIHWGGEGRQNCSQAMAVTSPPSQNASPQSFVNRMYVLGASLVNLRCFKSYHQWRYSLVPTHTPGTHPTVSDSWSISDANFPFKGRKAKWDRNLATAKHRVRSATRFQHGISKEA